tara:strand:+ start:1031 stop:1438 length:408 start_codon:yes stop_codon:yes gene_type:complete
MAVPGPGDGDKDKKKGALKKVMNIANSGKNQTNVETYDTVSGESSGRTVKKDSPADRVSKEFGRELTFGGSVSQAKPTGKAKQSNATNRNTGATMSTYGSLSPNFKGRAKDSKGKTVDFSTNDNDSRRGEKYRLF